MSVYQRLIWRLEYYYFDRFKTRFFDLYFNSTMQGIKYREFLDLKQNNLIVYMYKQIFLRLSYFAPFLVATKRDKCHRYEQDLRDEIRDMLATIMPIDFEDLMARIMRCEVRIKSCTRRLEEGGLSQGPSKRSTFGSRSSNGSRPRSSGSSNQSSFKGVNKVLD